MKRRVSGKGKSSGFSFSSVSTIQDREEAYSIAKIRMKNTIPFDNCFNYLIGFFFLVQSITLLEREKSTFDKETNNNTMVFIKMFLIFCRYDRSKPKIEENLNSRCLWQKRFIGSFTSGSDFARTMPCALQDEDFDDFDDFDEYS